MSIPLRVIRDRIRLRIRDFRASKPAYGLPELDSIICDDYIMLAARLPAARLYAATAFTITGGGDTFRLPIVVTGYTGGSGKAEYDGDIRIRLRSSGMDLIKGTLEELDSFRNGIIPAQPSQGIPYCYALWEESDQDVQGRCWPGAKVDEACDLFQALAADDLRDYVGAGTEDLDDVSVLFSRIAAQALIRTTSASLLEGMTDDEVTERRLDKRLIVTWRRDAEVLIWKENARRHRIAASGRTHRMVG